MFHGENRDLEVIICLTLCAMIRKMNV
jgi:hypothetical protein